VEIAMAEIDGSIPAFKEWQVVCDALARGEQTLILRKGGIAEGRQGFQWKHDEFCLFPTRFHQQEEGVKGERCLAGARADGGIEISLIAKIVLKKRVADWSAVNALADHHIWKEGVVRERFDWGDEPGLSVAIVRVYRLAPAWVLQNSDRREFGGCRSWLALPSIELPEVGCVSDVIAGSAAVIDDEAFAARVEEMRELLGGLD
jgi:hypothetical protein